MGDSPLSESYAAWIYGRDYGRDREGGRTCRWLLQNGGGQHLSPKALRSFSCLRGQEEANSNLLIMWMRENIQLYDTFMQERSLQILDGVPGIMEVIGDYMGLIQGKEIRMLKEFNELVFEHIDTHGWGN